MLSNNYLARLLLCLVCLLLCATTVGAQQQEIYVEPSTGMEFVHVEGGCFIMGSLDAEAGRFPDEGPQRQVCVDTYMLSRYEVTNAQYRQFDPAHESRSHEGKTLDADNQPVVFVSWDDARKFADWLSRRSGKHFRLPSEVEWEYAARAGSEASHFWGESEKIACSYANIGDQTAESTWDNWARWPVFGCKDGFTVSAPVGSFQPNAFGLYDMLGNVWEWTSDWYDESYAGLTASSSPMKPRISKDRALRGGSWYSGPRNARHARRSWSRPDSRCNSLGFRLALEIK